MEIEKYYEPSGREHTVKSEWSFGLYRIYVDGEFYANADDRLDKRETIDELVKYKLWSEKKYSARACKPISGVIKKV